MRNLLLTITLVLFNFNIEAQHLINVEFILDEKKQDITNSFELFFINADDRQKTIIKPRISNNTFLLPNLCGWQYGNVLFKYKQKNITIGIGVSYASFNQNMKWVIGLDKMPFNRQYYIKDFDKKKTKGIVYIEFHPLEKGEGNVAAIPILNFKEYNNSCKKLLK